MSHIEFLVEEPSAEVALRNLLPKILPNHITYLIHPHNGKYDLLRKLPKRLTAYKKWMPAEYKIVVLIDKDREDCISIKNNLNDIAKDAGLTIKTSVNQNTFQILNRIAIEELEAWFLGDVQALELAYPGVPKNLSQKSDFRNPDSIRGGTWERLETILQHAGYFTTGLQKINAASSISLRMVPEHNTSKSFQVFISGLKTLVS